MTADDDYVRKTIAELKQLDPDVVIPMHCTGPTFVQFTREEMPDRLITSTTGTEYTFGACGERMAVLVRERL